jgi:branched-chain amino acid transport system permease protein
MRTETTVIKWRDLLQMSLLFGVGLLYVSVIGMVETFNARIMLVGIPALGLSGLTVGRLLLFSIPWLAGLFVIRRGLVPQKWGTAVLAGAAAGAITTLWIALLIIIETLLNQAGTSLRNIFVNISPNLLDLLLYGQSVPVGLTLLLLTNILMGILGATYPILPERPRRTLGAAFATVFTVGLFGEIFTQLFRPIFGNTNIRLFFQSGALTPLGIAITFTIGALGGLYGTQTRQRQQTWVNSLPSEKQIRYRWAQVIFSTLLLILLPWLIGSFLSEVAVNVGIYIMMALGLNIAIGLAGLLDLGYVTNYAVGAYIMAILTSLPPDGSGYGLNFWIVLPLCMLGAMITGFVFALPVLRMRGDYLAIATLGFGEIIRILAISDWLSPLLGGAQGILYIPKPSLFGFTFGGPQTLYYIVLAGVLFVLYYLWRLNNSRTGRQWMAIREDEDVAEAMGINLVKTKVLAFTVSAAAGGLAGGIFAAKLGTVFPQSFNAFVSINVLSIIIVGGMGSIPGIIVGGIFLVGMPEILREFAEYRMLIYGALLVLMMLQRPEGLIPSAVRQRELKGQNPDDNLRLEHDLHRAGALDSETTIH